MGQAHCAPNIPTGPALHTRYALGPIEIWRWVPDKLSEPLPSAFGSQAQAESLLLTARKLQGSHSRGCGLEAGRPQTLYRIQMLQLSEVGWYREGGGGHRRGKAALPLWEVFHPLRVPTGEVMEGKVVFFKDTMCLLTSAGQPAQGPGN